MYCEIYGELKDFDNGRNNGTATSQQKATKNFRIITLLKKKDVA